MDAGIAQAESQLKGDEINEAFGNVEGAQRLDPENSRLKSLMSQTSLILNTRNLSSVSSGIFPYYMH